MTEHITEDEWFTLDDIQLVESKQKLYCISVDSPTKQFLIGKTGVPTHNTDEGKAEDELRGEASMILGSIARLGRAAGVHLIVATQRPDASIIPGETKANLGVRVNCGRTDSSASNMILGTSEGTRVQANPKGRLYLRIFGAGDHGQGFYAKIEWIDEYLGSKGLNPDGTPITQPRSKLAHLTDFSEFEDGDLDTQSGVDNAAVIDQLRAEEAELADAGDAYDDEDEAAMFADTDNVAEDVDTSAEAPQTEGEKAGLILGQDTDEDKFHRPEEDWDMDLENLIRENNKD